MDTLICGNCQQSFHDLSVFVEHKNTGCHAIQQLVTPKVEIVPQNVEAEIETSQEVGLVVTEDAFAKGIDGEDTATVLLVPEGSDDTTEGQVFQVQHIVQNENGEETIMWANMEQMEEQINSTQDAPVDTVYQTNDTQDVPVDAVYQTNNTQDAPVDTVYHGESPTVVTQTTHYVTEDNPPKVDQNVQGVHLVPMSNSGKGAVDFQILVKQPDQQSEMQQAPKNRGRKRGRPKKSDQKTPSNNSRKPTLIEQERSVKPDLPEPSADGRYHCSRCKKSFLRPRHFKTHSCLANSDYVDYNTKEAKIDLDLFTDDEEDFEDKDPTVEFCLDKPNTPGTVRRGRGRPRKAQQSISALTSMMGNTSTSQPAVFTLATGAKFTIKNLSDLTGLQEQIEGDKVLDMPLVVQMVEENNQENEFIHVAGQAELVAEVDQPMETDQILQQPQDEHLIQLKEEAVTKVESQTLEELEAGEKIQPQQQSELVVEQREAGNESEIVKISAEASEIPKIDPQEVQTSVEEQSGVIDTQDPPTIVKPEVTEGENAVKLESNSLDIKLAESDIHILPAGEEIPPELQEGAVVLTGLSDKDLPTYDELRKAILAQQNLDAQTKKPVALRKRPVKKVDIVPGQETNVPDLPVFTKEEDKIAFNQALNVDLSIVDHLYATHLISQELNDKAPQPTNRIPSDSLSVFSCTTCQKVYMSMSHVRLHCLVHTDLKPFRCFKCDFSTNTKGNLYTHMRRHTGQLYRCNHCDFSTSNKGHLIEHEEIHSNVTHECEICHKMYSTTKSLGNHVKRYHANTEKGKKYAEKFQKRKPTGPAMLHMCQVCNRKFKKKSDRDRHLLVHNIRDGGSVFECSLCDYVTSRRHYLQKHTRKHKVIFVCCECKTNFPSSKKLQAHPCAQPHVENNSWSTFFTKCLEKSRFLPDDNLEEVLEFEEQEIDPEVMENSIDISAIMNNQNQSQEVQRDETNPAAENELVIPADVPSTSSEPNEATEPEEEYNVAQVITCFTDTTGQEQGEDGDQLQFLVKPSNEGQQGKVWKMPRKKSQPSAKPVNGVGEEDLGQGGTQEEASQDQQENEAPAEEESQPEVDGKDPKAASFQILAKMGYQPLTGSTFSAMRDTYGNEECEECGRLFITKSEYEVHVKTHTGEKPFGCDQCAFRSITRENLKRHIEREHEKMTFACNTCSFTTSTRSQLWAHELTHRKGPTVTCLKCDLSFDNQNKMKVHLSMKHPGLNSDEKKKILDAMSASSSKPGRKSYKCPFCSKVFHRANSELQKHMWIHQGLKPFKCPVCPHACRSKHNLTAHMLRHSQEKPFLCNQCGKAYKSRTALRWHVRSHIHGKIFRCNKCPYEGTQQSHLTRHLETHNIAKRFVCQHCDFSSNTAQYMKIHYTRNHRGQLYSPNQQVFKETAPDAKVYRCLSCDYLFGNLSDMKRHLRVRHHIQVEDLGPLESLEEGGQVATTTGDAAVKPVDEQGTTQYQIVEEGQSTQEVQIVQIEGEGVDGLQTLQYTDPDQAQLLQQIIDMQAKNPGSQLVADDGSIIIEPEVGGGEAGQQYVIQYVTEVPETADDEATPDATGDVEVSGLETGQYVQVQINEDGSQQDAHIVTMAQDEMAGDYTEISDQNYLAVEEGGTIQEMVTTGSADTSMQLTIHEEAATTAEQQQQTVLQAYMEQQQAVVVTEPMEVQEEPILTQ